ncbi:MAG TPA: fatty acid desaturase [Pyrinomonadaceae bacterium]|jgi:stearoyl-CoA desaturase (delta-9 desaturase)|nr:fatty acid desaturase [Pyrinomonadaceae bacterium]
MSRTENIGISAAVSPSGEMNETRLDVPFTIINITTTVAACVLPFYFYSRSSIVAFLLFYTITGLGLTLGYHRLFAHRAFTVPRWLERLIALCGYLAIQRGPIFWVAMHRLHHRYSDIPGRDPHTPREGWLHVHFGWHQRRRRDVWESDIYRRYTPDLINDRFYLFLDNERRDYFTYFGILFGSYVAGGLVGAFGQTNFRFDHYNAVCFLVWVGLLNRVAVLHAFGFINSVCHELGTRPFKTRGTDTSVNNVIVSLLIFGEGWHNNHHAHPKSARQGLRWYQWDPAWYGIWLLKTMGLAEKVHVPSAEAIRQSSLSRGGKAESVVVSQRLPTDARPAGSRALPSSRGTEGKGQ